MSNVSKVYSALTNNTRCAVVLNYRNSNTPRTVIAKQEHEFRQLRKLIIDAVSKGDSDEPFNLAQSSYNHHTDLHNVIVDIVDKIHPDIVIVSTIGLDVPDDNFDTSTDNTDSCDIENVCIEVDDDINNELHQLDDNAPEDDDCDCGLYMCTDDDSQPSSQHGQQSFTFNNSSPTVNVTNNYYFNQ